MSVKVHEPVCLDSAQDLYFWFDHFLGDQIKDEWATTIVGGATAVVVDAQTGGIVRLASPTNATGDDITINWGATRSLLVSKKVAFETRAKINDITQVNIRFGVYFNVNNFIQFFTIGPNWIIRTRNAGAISQPDSGVVIDTDYHVYRIEVHTHGGNHAHFYIDDMETANSPITTNLPTTGGFEHLQPYARVFTADTNETQLDIDYVVVRQQR